ncbi:hypothetical protein LB518_11785 [Mesorhizobium sp. BR1-1-16]|uniref:hypothetical protein n=1 Tax=Mesorhizobium sp. BR1-1-16 TaxID=2876653 RepID=UPI001CCF3EB1|nr:hypothetical protein [Mesorhizobium sp. BR1-1-16]MBZ9936978.1 hypothetical protein [Mesorhizobium sp. BR1-1-16]
MSEQPVRTADRLRHEIDSGSGSDKIAFPDPAASPLGTDDEAAGQPPGPEQVALAAQHELTRPAGAVPGAAEERSRGMSEQPKDQVRWIAIALVVVLLAAGLGFAVL